MIIFIRSFIPDFDGKIKKYFTVCDEHGIKRQFVGWPRGSHKKEDTGTETYYARPAGLGGGIKNILNILLWNGFVFRTLWARRRQFAVIHAIDLDSAATSWLFARLFRKKFIFDVYDKYTDVRRFPKALISLFDRTETFLIRHADLAILADENRYAQHGLPKTQPNVMVLENVPQQEIEAPSEPVIGQTIRIGYFGVLEPVNRGLEDMLAVAKARPGMQLHVVGYGPLSGQFEAAAKALPNVVFHGPMNSAEGLAIMAGMDILLGMYYKTVKNHLFASPNKYYEHLMLGRPLLSTAGTPPGEKVRQYNTGWGLDEGSQAIESWFDGLAAGDILEKSKAARMRWASVYQDYYHEHYEKAYLAHVRALAGAASPSA